jgi:hypothetical protein
MTLRLLRDGRFQKLRELDRFQLPPRCGRDLTQGIAEIVLRIAGQAIANLQGGVIRPLDRLDYFQQRDLVGGANQSIASIDSAGRTQDPVGHQVPQNLQQKSLGHLAVRRQSAAWHGALGFELGELQRRPDGIRNGAGEFHE